MLKLSKKITAAILAGAILSTSAITGSAVNESIFLDDRRINSGTLYIKSDAVPESATTYIRDIFANLYADDLDFLGYSFKEAKEMRLSPGFCATDFETGETLENVYYFPVMCGRNFVGMFTVTYFDGEYGYSFGKSEFADSLNKLKTMPGETAEIIMNEDATYGVVGSKVELLEEAFDADKEREQDVMHAISERALLELAEKKPDELEIDSAKTPWITDGLDANVVSIDAKSLYPEKVDIRTELKNKGNISYYGKRRNVPFVQNSKRTEAGGGFCCACCTSSLIEYYNNGESEYADENAAIIFNTLKTEIGGGTINVAKKYLEKNCNNMKFELVDKQLTWADVKYNIKNKNAPCYTSWANVKTESYHALVLCGYGYNIDDVDNSNYFRIYVMDPNLTKDKKYQVTSFGNDTTYTRDYGAGNKTYRWRKTLIRK